MGPTIGRTPGYEKRNPARYAHVLRILRSHYAGGRVLEIGCGGAQYKDCFPRDAYCGIDLRQNYAGDGPNVWANGLRLPFEENCFAFLFMVATFYLLPDVLRALTEFRRVLQPDGQLLIFDYQPRIKRRLNQTDPVSQRLLFPSSLLASWLEDAGFSDICFLPQFNWRKMGKIGCLVERWLGRPWLICSARRSIIRFDTWN